VNSDQTRFRLVEQLFRAARDLPADEHDSYLDQSDADASIRKQVKAMLLADADASGVLDAPAFGEGVNASVISWAANVTTTAPVPERIGPYRIIRIIGEGGMGIVYEAQQDNPTRRIALKLLRRHSTLPQVVRRFEQEGQILGRLEHPGIARVLETGSADTGDGRQPFIAMEFVRGRPLLEHACAHQLTRYDRLKLFAMICDAVHYAHQQGVVHRDLKPGNILVSDDRSHPATTTGTGRSTSYPKILDFGVARLTDADIQAVTMHTTVGELIGTVPYMSPE